MTNEFKHLELYERPSHYVGATWYGYYNVAGRHRDSDTLSNSNWDCWVKFLTELLGPEGIALDDVVDEENDGDEVYRWVICREGHWAVGWIEVIRVHKSVGEDRLRQIDEQLQALDDYPVFDENHYSEMEVNEREENWDNFARQEWRRWLDKVAGDELSEKLEKIPDELLTGILFGAYQSCCMDEGDTYSYPSDKYTIQDMFEAGGNSYLNEKYRDLVNLFIEHGQLEADTITFYS